MCEKFLILLLILLTSSGQATVDIGIVGGKKSLRCSNGLGKMELTSEITYSSAEDVDAFFLMKFKNAEDKKKRLSICHLSLSKNAAQNGTEPQEEPKSPESESQSDQKGSKQGTNPSQSEEKSSPNSSKNGANSSQKGSNQETNPSPSGESSSPNPSKSVDDSSKNGTNPSSSNTAPTKRAPVVPNNAVNPNKKDVLPQKDLEPQEEENESEQKDSDIDADIDSLIEKMKSKIEGLMEGQFMNDDIKNIFGNLSSILYDKLNAQEIALEKFIKDNADKLKNGVNFFKQLNPQNLKKIIDSINFDEVKGALNSFIESVGDKIKEAPKYLNVFNLSDILEDLTTFLVTKDKTKIVDKIVNNLNSASERLKSRIVLDLEGLKALIESSEEGTIFKNIVGKVAERIKTDNNEFENLLQIIPNFLLNRVDNAPLDNLRSILDKVLLNLTKIIEENKGKEEILGVVDELIENFNNAHQKLFNASGVISELGAIFFGQNNSKLIEIIANSFVNTSNRLNSHIVQDLEELKELIKNSDDGEALQTIKNKSLEKIKYDKSKFDNLFNSLLNKSDSSLLNNLTSILDKILLNLTKVVEEEIGKEEMLSVVDGLINNFNNAHEQIFNASGVISELGSIFLDQNKSKLYGKIADVLDTSLTQMISRFIEILNNLKDMIGDNTASTKIKEIMDDATQRINDTANAFKELIDVVPNFLLDEMNQEYITNLRSLVNETLFNIPRLIKDEIEKKNILNAFDKLIEKFNSTNLEDTVRKVSSAFKGDIENANITNVRAVLSELVDKTESEIKTLVNTLNDSLLTETFKKFQDLNSNIKEQFIQKLNLSTVLENFLNKVPELESYAPFNNAKAAEIYDKIREVFSNILGMKVDENNSGKISDIVKEQMGLLFNAFDSLVNETVSIFTKGFTNILGRRAEVENDENGNDILSQLMDLLKEQNQHLLEVLSNIDFSSIIEDIKSNQNDINKFFNNLENQTMGALNNFVEKITNSDFNSIKETLSTYYQEFSNGLNQLAQSLNGEGSNIDTFIQALRGMIESKLNSFDIDNFAKVYETQLTKVIEEENNFINSFKSQDISIRNILKSLYDLKDQIEAKLEESDLQSIIQENLNAIYAFFSEKTNGFQLGEISKIFSQYQNIFNNSRLYPLIKSYSEKMQSKSYELGQKLYKRDDLLGSITQRLAQMEFTNFIDELNMNLISIKNDIVSNFRDVSNIEERKKELRQYVVSLGEKLLNISSIKEKINNILEVSPVLNEIVQNIFSSADAFRAWISSINFEDFYDVINQGRMGEIISKIDQDLQKDSLIDHYILGEIISNLEQAFFAFEDAFIDYIKNYFVDDLSYTQNQLLVAKVEDVPAIGNSFIQKAQGHFNPTFNNLNVISSNDNLIDLKYELIETFNRIKQKFEENLNINKILFNFKNLPEIIESSPLVQAFENFLHPIFQTVNQTINNIYISQIIEFIENITSSNNVPDQSEILSVKTANLINTVYFDSSFVQTTTEQYIEPEQVSGFANIIIRFLQTLERQKFEDNVQNYETSMESVMNILENLDVSTIVPIISSALEKFIDDLLTLENLIWEKFKKNEDEGTFKRRLQERLIDKIMAKLPILQKFLEKAKESLSKFGLYIPTIDELHEIIRGNLENLKYEIYYYTEEMKERNAKEVLSELILELYENLNDYFSTNLKNIFNSDYGKQLGQLVNNEGVLKILDLLKTSNINPKLSEKLELFEDISEFLNYLNGTVNPQCYDSNDDGYLDVCYYYYFDLIELAHYAGYIFSGIKDSGAIYSLLGISPDSGKFDEYEAILYLINEILYNAYENAYGYEDVYDYEYVLSVNDKEEEPLKNNRNRRAEETATLICKIDDSFSGGEHLTEEAENINSFILKSNVDLNITVNSEISFDVSTDFSESCQNNNENIVQNLNLNSISDLTIEASKKRFTFDIAVGMSSTFEIPDFLYLLVKVKVITKSNGLRLLDTPEDVNTYCLLGDATDKSNVKFTCFGYNDNLDENSQITLSNFTSEYINFNESLSLPYPPQNYQPNNEALEPNDANDADANGKIYYSRSSDSGLSAGAIAGIIIACVAAVAIAVTVVLLLRKKKKDQKSYEISDSVHNLQVQANKV